MERQGDGIHYDPVILNQNIETMKEYLDGKKTQGGVKDSLQRQKQQYKKELEEYIAFNKKVVWGNPKGR